MQNYYLAIDIGASSGRHILGSVKDGKINLEEIYRFPNQAQKKNGHLCWDFEMLFDNIVEGLAKCGERGIHPVSIGIDTWGTDYALIDKEGHTIGDYVAYRDKRTNGAIEELAELIPDYTRYQRTGTQNHLFNTIFQLWALKKEHPEQLKAAERMMMTPQFFSYKLTGVKKSEYTNSSVTGLLNSETHDWDEELIALLGLPRRIFGKIEMPGTVVGNLKSEIAKRVGFCCPVILVASHDTASAVLAVPAKDENAVYISSGTWSLLGIELDKIITSRKSYESGFSNEGGYSGNNRFLKNIMGLWIVQSIRNELGAVHSFAELSALAKEATDFHSIIDVDDDCFIAPENMIETIKGMCRKTQQAVPETVGELMKCAYLSLAKCYADAIVDLEDISGKKFTSIHIVGGGCRDTYLNELTAQYTGLPVFTGPIEATAIGNLIAQMIRTEEFANLQEARAAVIHSFDIAQV